MSEYESPQASSGKKSPLPLIIGGVILLLAVAVLVYVKGAGGLGGGSAIKRVGALDQDLIFDLPEFKKAREEIEKMAKQTEADLEKKIPKDKPPTPEQQRQIQEARLKIQQESNKVLNPLKTRAEACVAQVARNKGMAVVLDKRIIVYGVPDITEDVKTLFQSGTEIKLPDSKDADTAPIGYFDQEVVRSLKVFQEAEVKIYQERARLLKEYEKKAKDLSPGDRELLEREFRLRVEAYQEQLMSPLFQKVNDAVKEVATSQGLSLVLDKQHVMQGGRNMTNEVVEVFLKKAGGSEPGAGSTPAAETTPAAGGK